MISQPSRQRNNKSIVDCLTAHRRACRCTLLHNNKLTMTPVSAYQT